MELADNSSSVSDVAAVVDQSPMAAASVITALLCVAAASVAAAACVRRAWPRRLDGVPGPPARPLLGNIGELLQLDAAEVFLDWTRRYGKIVQYSVGLGGGVHVLVCDAAAARRVLASPQAAHNYPKSASLLSVVRRVFGPRCLISLPPQEHDRRRRIVAPAFKSRALAAMLPRMAALAVEAAEAWRAAAAGAEREEAEVAVRERVAELSADALCACVLGYELRRAPAEGAAMLPAGDEQSITESIHRVMAVEDLSWLRLVPFYDYLPTAWNRNIRRVKRFAAQLLDKKRKEMMAEAKAIASGDHDSDDRKQPRMLDLLIEASSGEEPSLTDAEIVDDLVQFLIAGHETLTGALCWALLEVARRPNVQSLCRREARRVLPLQPSRPLGREHVGRLRYCACVVKETLRLHTTVPLTARVAAVDDVLGGFRIPAGTNITLAVAAMMRQPDYFPEPDRFWPERFLGDDSSNGKIGGTSYASGKRGGDECEKSAGDDGSEKVAGGDGSEKSPGDDKSEETAGNDGSEKSAGDEGTKLTGDDGAEKRTGDGSKWRAGDRSSPGAPPAAETYFMPFLCGPGMCIGHKMALLEMTLVLALLVRDLEFRPLPGVEYKGKQGLTRQMQPPLRLLVSCAVQDHEALDSDGKTNEQKSDKNEE